MKILNVFTIGFACPLPSSTGMLACNTGTFSAGNQAACTVCPAGNSF